MTVTRTEVGECRQCRSFCDKMVEPRGCIELGCRFLYSYVDRFNGQQYVGCMQEVFARRGRALGACSSPAASAASR